MEAHDRRRTGKQVSQLNRFQRSRLAGSVAAVSKDSTVEAAKFLTGVLEELGSFLHVNIHDPTSWRVSFTR